MVIDIERRNLSMASSMSLALVLSAVDKMGPILKNAEDKLKSIKRTTEGMKKMEVTINIKEVRETVQKLKNDAVKKSESLQRSGAKDIAEGTALGLPVFGALKVFCELEKQLNNYTIATYDSSKSAEEMAANVRKAEEEAMKLGDATKYNTAEAIRTFEVLAKGGIDESVITGGLGKGAIYLAQLEELNPEEVAGSLSTVSNAFDKGGGNLGQTGSVSFMFDRKGIIAIEKTESIDEDELTMQAIELGAEDFISNEDGFEITTIPEDFNNVRNGLQNAGYQFAMAEISYVPQTTVTLTDETDIKNMNKLIDLLEDSDDVQEVYHNWEEPEEE